MSFSNKVPLLFVVFTTLLICVQLVHGAKTVEFVRSSTGTVLRPYYSSTSSSKYLWARSPESKGGWLPVCYSFVTTYTAQAICLQMGLSATNARLYASYSSSTRYGFSSLSCSASSTTVTGNSPTNFSQCTYDSYYSSCGRYTAKIRCGSHLSDGGTHGFFAGSFGAGTTERDAIFLRQRKNGQIQSRTIFKTTWKNVYASKTSLLTYNTANALCLWTRGVSSSYYNPKFLFMDRTMNMVNPSDRTILDSANGNEIGDLNCGKSAANLDSCGVKFARDSNFDYSAYAVSVECDGATSSGRSMGDGWAIRLTSTRTYKNVEIGKYPFSGNNAFRSSCTTFFGTISDTTATALCQMAGYGENVNAIPSSTSTSSAISVAARYTSIVCKEGTTSWESGCTYKTSYQSYCSSGKYLTLQCSPSSSTPAPYNGGGSSSYNDDLDGPSKLNPAYIIIPVLAVVFAGIFMFVRYKQQNILKSFSNEAASASNAASSSSSISNDYHNFSNSSSPFSAGSINNDMFMTNMTPMNAQRAPAPRPINNHQSSSSSSAPPGMTTFRDIEAPPPPPPPPSGYNPGGIPGFGFYQHHQV